MSSAARVCRIPRSLLLLTLAATPAALHAQLVPTRPRAPVPVQTANVARAVINDNRVPAGKLRGKVLTLALDVVESAWRPEGDEDPELPVFAFAERGREPRIPGPLIRVPQGTEVRLMLTNRVDSTLMIGGLRPGTMTPPTGFTLEPGPLLGPQADRWSWSPTPDTVYLAPGATRELTYRLDTPGTYFYWGALKGTAWLKFGALDSQLHGAIVVDPPGGAPPDRVIVLGEWFTFDWDHTISTVLTMNGKAWPYTERLTLPQGDSVRFRVVNTTALWHPMHLHGFYYRVTARGTWERSDPIAPALQPQVNVDLLRPGGTLDLAFLPTTPGNWIFHCHFSMHIDDVVTLSGAPRAGVASVAATPNGAGSHHLAESKASPAGHDMRGLVMGLHVTPAPGYKPPSLEGAREIRLFVQKQPNQLAEFTRPAYGFMVQNGDTPPPPNRVRIPGPVLELERGKPVRIVVLNKLDEPTGIHWHGLEIESFPDGVANWSGMGDRIFPPVAPGDSFVAAFTPPRAGTFLYHSHLNERHQILSGMYGALVVTDTPRDPARDHLVVVGGGGPPVIIDAESPYALVNGSGSRGRPLRLTAGEVHRLRLVSIHPDWRITYTLRNAKELARWRAVAKDGADLPAAQATERVAHVEMGPGETADFEFAPPAPGEWVMEIKSLTNLGGSQEGWYIQLPVVVEPAANRPTTPEAAAHPEA